MQFQIVHQLKTLNKASPVYWRILLKRCIHKDSSTSNLILMGSPGCGKTTIGRILSAKLGRPVLDIDDDYLEAYWGMPVAQKLEEVGSDGFVEAEGMALKRFHTEGSIVSLTGSNPMHSGGMYHVASTGTVVFIDVHQQDILERLERMKVNRIVGQNDGTSMADILKYRQQFYEKWYDTRVICERHETPQSIVDKIIAQLQRNTENRGYESTRGFHMKDKGFNDVLLQGLAPDGGLIVPRGEIPRMSLSQLSRLVDLTYSERALRIVEQWINHTDLHPRTLRNVINKAYTAGNFAHADICPVRKLGNGQFIQELFHGPTASFKDVALQLMPQLFINAVENENQPSKYIILVATSGDTGGAVLDGFTRYGRASSAKIGVLVLYPEKGISEIQRDQMTSYNSATSRVVGVTGSDFDFCQTSVKKIFGDAVLARRLQEEHNLKLSAANSISWGRLLPQVVYHVTSYLDLVKQKVITMGDEIDLCVPTGNFGNILAAYYAKKMGVPIKRLICASNSNNILSEFLTAGHYDISGKRLQKTISPAIDILVSSNLERLIYNISENDAVFTKTAFEKLRDHRQFHVSPTVLENLRSTFVSDWCDEQHCADALRETLRKNNYLMDPHTSVAKAIADRFPSQRPLVIASTAHPGKFANDVLDIIGASRKHVTPAEMQHLLADQIPNPGIHQSLLKTLKDQRNTNDRPTCGQSLEQIEKQISNIVNEL